MARNANKVRGLRNTIADRAFLTGLTVRMVGRIQAGGFGSEIRNLLSWI